MRELIEKLETKTFRDKRVQRHIETSVKELRSLAKKGTGDDVRDREEEIFKGLLHDMKANPFNFLMSLLNVMDAGSDYKRSVLKGEK